MRTAPSDSVSRPVTSALIFPRSRKIGRIVVKARLSTTAKPMSTVAVMSVIVALMRRRTTSEINAVMMPPTNSTRPVPIRLRTPSTSLMMRETSAPVRLAS